MSERPHRVPLKEGATLDCLAPGTLLGGYHMCFHALGRMSLCYRAKRGTESRFVKEVKAESKDAVEALRLEWSTLKELNHPGIVKAHRLFTLGGYFYLVLDFVEGHSLTNLVPPPGATTTPITEASLLDFGSQLSQTLSYLHTRKPPLVYGNLQPGNIILTPQGNLVIVDLSDGRHQKVGVGTFVTSAPERFSGPPDARSDLYSLGATLRLLAPAGQSPRKTTPAYSKGLESLLQTCLAPLPEARYASAKILTSEIKKLQMPSAKTGRPTKVKGGQASPRIANLTRHLALYARQLGTLLEAGTPLVHSLEVLSKQAEVPGLAKIFSSVAGMVNSGSSLSKAYLFHSKVFPAAFINLVLTGEATGRLGECIHRSAQLLEKEDNLSRRIRSALVYPAFVIALASTLGLFMFTTILPEFLDLFRQMNVELPQITRFIMFLTDLVRQPGSWLVAAGVGLAGWETLVRTWELEDGRQMLYAQVLKIPLVGRIVRLGSLARYCWVFETLLNSGIGILRCLELAAQTSGNPGIVADSARMKEALTEGDNPAELFRRRPDLYPSIITQMVSVGQDTNSLGDVFKRLALWFDGDLEVELDLLNSVLEPVIMAVLAIGVGTVVISIFLPLYSIIGQLGT